MATIVLGAVGSAIGGSMISGTVLGLTGAAIGGMIGSTVGSMVDSWIVSSMMPGQRKAMDKSRPVNALREQLEKLKGRIRAKVEHPFRVIKRQFGYAKVRYRGLKKNTLQIKTLFALSNLWMARHKLMGCLG